ncbi:hypothetical protein AKJ45_00475 [candidate division MSBL1 archaeon SCGC-AAA261F19]|uniref:Small ribosomal subunit protein eS4 n=2 Tax=candidate division MSBL1 TaxID=215777 RepID=A0A133VBG9_9EURY|nr:hypothetical protein AKJ43_00470 [candidate division MSBL1 archaeon SCGC-AAA261D19]KXB03796.1 hypothetical protein AKJ45_00475 [candidate division MSBL1 archaeon SCGC-AAA261F19]
MAKKGQKRHQKRLSAPAKLKLPRKTKTWTVKPAPGPHPVDECLPLSILVRDYLRLGETRREVNRILSDGLVQVDGRTRKDSKFPVGLMDIVRVPKADKSWRIIFDMKGYLVPYEVPKDEAEFKLARVVGKSLVKERVTQISLHDGKTCTGDFEEINSNDVVKLNLPEVDVIDKFPFENGKPVLITGGSQVGKFGVISEDGGKDSSTNVVTIKAKDGSFQASRDHVFVIGKKEPAISLPRWLSESNA